MHNLLLSLCGILFAAWRVYDVLFKGQRYKFIDGKLVREDYIYYSGVKQELIIFNDKIKNVKDMGNN